MEEIFEDVLKVIEEIKSGIGPDVKVNPNEIFVKLEALQHESSWFLAAQAIRIVVCIGK